MAKGITIESGSPRTLNLEGVEVAAGGSANQAGLYAVGDKLYLDGEEIADAAGTTGLLINDGELTYNGEAVGGDTPPTPPTPPMPSVGLWVPPMQEASSRNKYTYREYVANYDALMTGSDYPGTVKKYEYNETQNGIKRLSYGSNYHDVPNMAPLFTEVQSGAFNDVSGAAYTNLPLYHYEFVPTGGYTKTYILEAGIHGSEHDAPQTLYRMMDIICNHANENDYSRFAQIRDNVRLIVIPVVNPWGHDNGGLVGDKGRNNGYLNRLYTDWDGFSTKQLVTKDSSTSPAPTEGGTDGKVGDPFNCTVNLNRNGDFNHTFPLGSGSGDAANYPWQFAEVRHVKALVERIGAKNIDFFFDYHDGEGVKKHFWFNYNMDGVNGLMSRTLLDDLIAYEEELRLSTGTDYRRPNGTTDGMPDKYGYIHPNVADQGGYSTGTLNAWLGITLGVASSGPEYIGGIFGYDFSSEMKTRSLRIRGNHLIYAYEMCGKGWTIGEANNVKYYHWDYGKAMTRQGLRRDDINAAQMLRVDGVNRTYTECYSRLTIVQVYDRWDALTAANPTYITKSASLGQNNGGTDIYSYTLGSGSKKVLFLGGTMRWLAQNTITEFGIYLLAEYLCDDYIVNQSAFLQRLKSDYTIVVLPCIDVNAGGAGTKIGLNSMTGSDASGNKWTIINNKCQPTSYGLGCEDVTIFKNWIDQQTGALILLSGGEDPSKQGSERPLPNTEEGYTTTYMTQFILPKNVTLDWLDGYCTHLEDDRGEDAPDVDHTNGKTSGDYAYDNIGIKTVYVNLKVSNMWEERRQYAQENDSADLYMYRSYETGRRIANIVNIFLMAGGDIAAGGGLVNNND